MEISEDYSGHDISELVGAIREDLPGAADELVRRFGRGVRFALRKEGNPTMAIDDLFQETFCIALENIKTGKLRDSSSMGSFLYGIARLTVWDHNRRERKKREREVPTMELAAGSDPYHTLQRDESARLVRKVLDELPNSRDREVIYRVYIEEEDRQEICRELDLSLSQLNLILHRARERYRDLYLKKTSSHGSDRSAHIG